MISRQHGILGGLLIAGLVAGACGKKKEDKKDESAVEAESVADLKLSSSLSVVLPDAFAKASGQATALNMSTNLVGKKSSEACRTISQVNQMFGNLRSISGMMCHLEAESAQFKFGTKYKVVLTQQGQTMDMPLWVDNSTAGQLTMYTCQGGKIKEKILISGSNTNGPRGSVQMKGSEGSNTYASSVSFDFMTAGVKTMSGQNIFSDGSNTYKQDLSVDLKDSGVSFMKMSSKGSQASMGTFEDRGAVFHNGTLGQSLFKGQGTSTSYGAYNFSSRATFNAEGISVANSQATSDITVKLTDLPEFLASDFAISDATGWDCSTDETVTVDVDNGPTAAAHAKCEQDHNYEFNCWGTDFEQGTPE